MPQSRYRGLELGEIFAVRRGHGSIILQLRSEAGVDVQAKQCLVEKGIRYDGYISSELPRTKNGVSSLISSSLSGHILTSGMISAGSVTSRWASSSLNEIRWAISTSQ